MIKDLLDYKRDESGNITRPPRLYVTDNCKQVIWMLENYTGKAGETGASKDPCDTVRYMASAELVHVTDRTFAVRGANETENEDD